MSRQLVTLEVDTDRDVYGDSLGANFTPTERVEDGEVRAFAETFGGGAGAQWDDDKRCWVRILNVQPMTGEAVLREEIGEPTGSSRRAEGALTQCQHVAYDALLEIEAKMRQPAGRLTPHELRMLANASLRALNRVNDIAERGYADPEFQRELDAAR
jgi:hypothetical protein